MSRRSLGLVVGGLIALLAPVSPALAGAPPAPVTVNLRIEGPTRTLFEGPVTTGVRTFDFTGESAAHVCDGTGSGGSSPSPVVTKGAVLSEAIADGLSVAGTWGSFGATFTTIDGDGVAYDAGTGDYLGEFLNGVSSMVGACNEEVHAGDDALFAYGAYGAAVLKLTAPLTATPGQAITGTVTDAGTGVKIAGAVIGSATSAADGTIAIGPFSTGGDRYVKATKPGAIRSNRVRICVSDGHDGFCGSTKTAAATPPAPVVTPPAPDTTPALPTIAGLAEQARFTVAKAPRELQGTVVADASGVKEVLLSLTRRSGRRCERYDGAKEAWITTKRCGAQYGTFFRVGTGAAWTYLLPKGLTKGRYVLDVRTVDGAGNVTRGASRGAPGSPRTRVVFHVR